MILNQHILYKKLRQEQQKTGMVGNVNIYIYHVLNIKKSMYRKAQQQNSTDLL